MLYNCAMEQLTPHLTLDIRHDNKLYIWTMDNFTPETIEAWFVRASAVLEGQPDLVELYTVYDLRQADHMTLTGQQRIQEFTERYGRRIRGATVYVINPSPNSSMIKRVLKEDVQRHFPLVASEIFYAMPAALYWVESHLIRNAS